MPKIKLSKNEFSYLSQASFVPKRIHSLLFSHNQTENGCLINISEEQADEIRDLCGERLQVAGFDKNYKLTPEGELLEVLIDKFFTV